MASAQIDHSPSNKRLILGAQLAFLPTGVLMTLLGPMLPLLIARWALNDSQAGNLFLVQFLAAVVGVQLSGVLLARLGYRPAFLSGLLLMAAGAALLYAGSVGLGMAAIGVYGLGVGLIVPTDSLLIAEISGDSRTRAVNLLNFFWGFGAVFCSLMVAWASAHKMLPVFLGAVSLFLVLLVFAMWSLPFPPAAAPSDRGPRWQELARNPVIWLFAAVFFFYPGAETAVGGWIGSYVARLGPQEAHWAPLMPAFFWSALTTGRALGTLFLSYLSERRVLRAGFATAAGGIVLMLVASTLPGVIARSFDYRTEFCHAISHHHRAAFAALRYGRAQHRGGYVFAGVNRPGGHSVDGGCRLAKHGKLALGIIAAAGGDGAAASDPSF